MMTIMTAIMTTTNTVHPPEVLTKVAKAVTKEDIAVIEMNLVVAGTVLVVVSVDKLVAEVTEVNPAVAEMAGMAEVNLVVAGMAEVNLVVAGTAEVVLEVAGVRLDAAEALHAVNQNPNPNSNKNPNHNSNISPSSVPSAGVRLRKKSTLHFSSNGNLNRLKLIPRAKIWLLSLVDRARFAKLNPDDWAHVQSETKAKTGNLEIGGGPDGADSFSIDGSLISFIVG
jgi:hypothetical protein